MTAVVWLGSSFRVVFLRVRRRTIRRSVRSEHLWHANRESNRRAFLSRESILLWVATTHRRPRAPFRQLRSDNLFPGIRWIESQHPAAATRFLHALQQPAAD